MSTPAENTPMPSGTSSSNAKTAAELAALLNVRGETVKSDTAKIVELREGREPAPRDSEARDTHARDTHAPATQSATPSRPASRRSYGRGFMRFTLMSAGIIAVLIASAIFWLRGGRYVSTDNSYLRAAKLMVSTDVSGIVARVEVRQGQAVKQNEVLFRLDPRQFEIALTAARAQRDQVRLSIEASRRDYARIRSDIAAAEAVVKQARAVFERADTLAQRNAGSQAQLDQARNALSAEESRLASLRQAAQAALTRLGGDADLQVEKHPQFIEAQARVAETQRQLDRTIVRAPFAGTVTSVESLQPGAFLVAATAALTNTGAVGLVSSSNIWIEANMKETDLTHVRAGQDCEIVIDAYPNRIWKGKIESIFPVTGAEFSILPAQNASGNWVKVVQRIPVRVSVLTNPGDPPLRSGMSAVVTVDTQHRRTMADLWRLAGFSTPPVDFVLPGAVADPRK